MPVVMASTTAPSRRPATPRRTTWWREAATGRLLDAAILVGLTLVAAGLRLYRLAEIPPGLHHDEAVNGLDALFTIPTQHPIFFEANNGREPLFIYLQAATIHLFGPSPWSLRLTSAIIGTLTVLAVYALGRAWLGRVGGAIAAFALATSFWHLDLSRIGLRAIGAPLFLTLALLFLWRGLRDRRLVFCALAGVCFALDLYTYTSARVAVALIPAIFAWELLRAPRYWRRRLVELVVVGAVTVALVAPLGLYFLDHSGSLIRRADEVWIFNPNPQIESKPVGFAENTWNTLDMFFVRGDLNPRQNIPGRPIFDPVAAPWFVLGLLVLVWRAAKALGFTRRPRRAEPTTSREPPDHPEWSVWLLLWLASMLSLGAVTYESPDFLRLSALAPATFLTWALGLVVASRWIVERFGLGRGRSRCLPYCGVGHRGLPWGAQGNSSMRDDAHRDEDGSYGAKRNPTPRQAPVPDPAPVPAPTAARIHTVLAGLAVLVLVVGFPGFEAGRSTRDYLGVWAGRADVYEGFDGSLTAAARLVESGPPGRALVFYVDRSPNILFESPRSRGGRWLQQYSDLLLLPADLSEGATYVFGQGSFDSSAPTRFFADLTPIKDVDSAGKVGFVAYDLSAVQLKALATPAVPRTIGFGGPNGPVEVVGYTLDHAIGKPGSPVILTVEWRARTDLETIYAPFLHVVDDSGRSWGQDDLNGFAVHGWKAGDRFLSRFVWTVPVGTPPGSYHLEVGIARRVFGVPPGPAEPLGGPVELTTVSIDGLSVLQPGAAVPKPARPLDASLGDGLVLVGTSDLPDRVKQGDQPEVELLWQTRAAPSHDLKIDLALEGASGQDVVVSSRRPAGHGLPTNGWPAAVVLRDPRHLLVPGNAPTGTVRLVAIARDAKSGAEVGRTNLGTLEVDAPPRDFAVPHPDHPLNVRFGNGIVLLGYDLSATTLVPGGALRVTLYWQDLATPNRNYTGFAHLLDGANHVVAQQDRPPQDGKAPTVGWVPGQVVKDEYELTLAATVNAPALTLEVGMYDPTTGARLPTNNGDPQNRVVLGSIPLNAGVGR